ncbi:MAG: hypothetical protein QOG76_3609, partial [Pseudonocardiales bacterium]|nr:hypothetical protein [Pseudonocardiales bacterium]
MKVPSAYAETGDPPTISIVPAGAAADDTRVA